MTMNALTTQARTRTCHSPRQESRNAIPACRIGRCPIHGSNQQGLGPVAVGVARRAVGASTRTFAAATEVGQGVPLNSALVAKKRRINGIKLRLLSKLASLDRGLAANGRDVREVEELVSYLEATGGPVALTWGQSTAGEGNAESTMEQLQGKWRLLYTSGFSTGSLGGKRPGPPAAFVPSTLGQVYQVIDASPNKEYLDNVVEFILAGPPSLQNLLGSVPRANPSQPDDYKGPEADQLEDQPTLRLTLRHTYEVKGASTVEIVYEDTSAELTGNQLLAQLPKFDLPQLPEALKPPKNFRSATFQIVYMDDQMRVTRGDRQELRIYVKERDMLPEDKTDSDMSD